MSTELSKQNNAVSTIQELYENIEIQVKRDDLNSLLSQQPPAAWIKVHPFISNHKYLPIDKVEWMLRRIFKKYNIEIRNQGVAFNGIWVSVRVHYLDPVTGTMEFHDGIGACQLQTAKGTSPADLANINNGALSMAFPIAKTLAVKDACDHFGDAFGASLNRKDIIPFTPDNKLREIQKRKETERLQKIIQNTSSIGALEELRKEIDKEDEETIALYDIQWNKLNSK